MDPKQRFTDRVDDYAKYRPTYPAQTIAAIVDGFVKPVVADLGAGTGISSYLLADAGAVVYAVEPNAAMRALIKLAPAVTIVDGTAEATTLSDRSVDIVTAFQAYHWFDADAVLREAQRIVRPDGRFAAVWNHRDRNDAFTGAYEAIVDRYDQSGGQIDRRRRSASVTEDLQRLGWRNVRNVTSTHRRELRWETLVGLARSASYLPRSGSAYEVMEEELRALFLTWHGLPAFVYITQAYLAEAPPLE